MFYYVFFWIKIDLKNELLRPKNPNFEFGLESWQIDDILFTFKKKRQEGQTRGPRLVSSHALAPIFIRPSARAWPLCIFFNF